MNSEARLCPECSSETLYGVIVQGEALGPLFRVCSVCHLALPRRFTMKRLAIASVSYAQMWNLIQANMR